MEKDVYISLNQLTCITTVWAITRSTALLSFSVGSVDQNITQHYVTQSQPHSKLAITINLPLNHQNNTHVNLTPANSTTDNANTTILLKCLLKTAIAPMPVSANGTTASANILFDEGSQRSFISQDMVTKLQLQPTTTETLNVASFGKTEH